MQRQHCTSALSVQRQHCTSALSVQCQQPEAGQRIAVQAGVAGLVTSKDATAKSCEFLRDGGEKS